jgi:hypothetical protein
MTALEKAIKNADIHRRKYLGFGRVIGDMAPPTGWRYHPHACVARMAA